MPMKRMLLLLLLAAPAPFMPPPAEANGYLVAQRGHDWDKEEKEEELPIDRSIKEVSPRNGGLIFNKVLPASISPNKHVYYDKDYRGQGCVLGCDQFDGLVVKWTTFFLQIQPYEKNA